MADRTPQRIISKLQFPTHPVTQEMLDSEVRSMFKNREEGLDYINANFPEGHKDRETAMSRLDKVYPTEVEGSSDLTGEPLQKQVVKSIKTPTFNKSSDLAKFMLNKKGM